MKTENVISPQSKWATCVVCGHGIEPSHGAARINHRGNTINLCSPECLRKFATEPDAYLARLAKTVRERVMETEMACS